MDCTKHGSRINKEKEDTFLTVVVTSSTSLRFPLLSLLLSSLCDRQRPYLYKTIRSGGCGTNNTNGIAKQRGLLLLFLFHGMKESAQGSLDPPHLEAEFLDVAGTTVLRVFLLANKSPLIADFTPSPPPPPPSKSGLKLVCN